MSFVHYWTDSLTSQCRNKHIFSIILQHDSLFGIKAAWNYFKAGRNKGSCNVLGGTIIRIADNAIKQRKYVIQDVFDFFSWAESNASI